MLAVVSVLVLLVLALLAVPVDLRFRLERERSWRGECEIAWLFNLVHTTVTGDGETGSTRERRAKSRKASSRGPSSTNILDAIRDRRIRRHLVRALRRFIKACRFSDLLLRLRVGLDDPADTGRLLGMTAPVTAALACYDVQAIVIEPDFSKENLQLYGHGKLRIIPVELIWLTLRFTCSPVSLRLIRVLTRGGRR